MSSIEVSLNPDVTPSGSDLSVANAARRSFNTRSKEFTERDKRLIRFLARGMTAEDFDTFLQGVASVDKGNKSHLIDRLWSWRNTPTHDTPFSHTFISFEVKAPIFTRAQLVKHEYLILSEFSRRYITEDLEFYTPSSWRAKAKNKKQGSGGSVDNLTGQEATLESLSLTKEAVDSYHSLLSKGVSPEQARMVLPQSLMTEWTWSGTLGAFAKMCNLRMHKDSQKEAQLVAQKVYSYLKEYYPVSASALVEGVY